MINTEKTFVTVAVVAALCVGFVSGCGDKTDNGTGGDRYVQNIDTTESVDAIANPDQGFYRPMYVTMTESGVTYAKYVVTDATQLYHLRIDISAFAKATNGVGDIPLTAAALDGLDGLLGYIEERGKSAVVRFAYDPKFGGASNKEAALDMIVEHIGQVCPILNKYETTITAVEAGLVGPWGEMHTSALANSQAIKVIVDKFLSETQDLTISVRTPKMIYDHLGITLAEIDGYEIDPASAAYRLGLYNDGYLGSGNDLGTYTDREREIAFLSKITERTPYGGEVVVPSSSFHDIDKCLPEMFEMNLSYLNVEWNNEVIDKWKNTTYTAACGDEELYYGKTAFEYITNRMGYRFVVTDSVFAYSDAFDSFDVELDISNVGFGELNKPKQAKLVFVGADGAVAQTEYVGVFDGGENVCYTAELGLGDGEYEVYLCVYGKENDGEATYCVEFANRGMWNAELKANKIGEIEVRK